MTVPNTYKKVKNFNYGMSDNTQLQIERGKIKKILAMFVDTTKLLEDIPEMQDQGRLSEISQHIGAELEARITEMNEIEKTNPEIRELLDEIREVEKQQKPETLEDLENDVF